MGKVSGVLGLILVGGILWILFSIIPNAIDASVEIAESNAVIAQAEAISDVAHIAQIQAGTSAIVSTGMTFALLALAFVILFAMIQSRRPQQIYPEQQRQIRRTTSHQYQLPEGDADLGYYSGLANDPQYVSSDENEPVANTGYYGEGY